MFFFFNDTATTEIYTLSLHDALPICDDLDDARRVRSRLRRRMGDGVVWALCRQTTAEAILRYLDRKSTRLNSSHANISYAVFCLKKKNKQIINKDIYKDSEYIYILL